jgi:hypothetical protein
MAKNETNQTTSLLFHNMGNMEMIMLNLSNNIYYEHEISTNCIMNIFGRTVIKNTPAFYIFHTNDENNVFGTLSLKNTKFICVNNNITYHITGRHHRTTEGKQLCRLFDLVKKLSYTKYIGEPKYNCDEKSTSFNQCKLRRILKMKEEAIKIFNYFWDNLHLFDTIFDIN